MTVALFTSTPCNPGGKKGKRGGEREKERKRKVGRKGLRSRRACAYRGQREKKEEGGGGGGKKERRKGGKRPFIQSVIARTNLSLRRSLVKKKRGKREKRRKDKSSASHVTLIE